jgi:prepilin-type N-terminal cleavage/methylation domain-containing protein
MQLPRRGEKGFTLIELLIVVAILGVLAAIVIPNVGRFIGRGKTEAAATELASIQSAVTSMMTDQGLALLPSANITTTDETTEATNNMLLFPDDDATGAHLFHYGGVTTVNYVVSQNTTHKYWTDVNGTVFQVIVP